MEMSEVRETAILTEGLKKSYGEVLALDGVDLAVPPAPCSGCSAPTAPARRPRAHPHHAAAARRGRAAVPGSTSSRDAAARARADRPRRAVRRGRREPHRPREPRDGRPALPPVAGARRAPARGELLERFELADAADRPVRRPTRAACGAGSTSPRALVHGPPVLFLDEPTTGLDPRSRIELWGVIAELVRDGTTRAAHDAVPRGGRPPRRPHRGHRPRPRDRRGHADELKDQRRRRSLEVDARRRPPIATARAAALAPWSRPSEPVARPRTASIRVPVRAGAGVDRRRRARARRRRRRRSTTSRARADARRRVPLAHRPRRRGAAEDEPDGATMAATPRRASSQARDCAVSRHAGRSRERNLVAHPRAARSCCSSSRSSRSSSC